MTLRTRRAPALAWCVAFTLFLVMGQRAHAQAGALFLLFPFGAHAVGQGEAVVADSSLGTEGIWWNAAALARMKKREIAVHHSQTIISVNDMVAFAWPSKVLGTIGVAAYIVNYGDQDATDDVGNPIGVITNRNYLLAASYATPVGKHMNAGITYKYVSLRFNCDACSPAAHINGSTSALDIGAQYSLSAGMPITIGASIRNLGRALQIEDEPQADPLPRLVQVGVRARLPIASLARAGTTLDVLSDFMKAHATDGYFLRFGAALAYKDEYVLRGGYSMQAGEGGGPSIGFGIRQRAIQFDVARRFDKISSSVNESPPTFVSLRIAF